MARSETPRKFSLPWKRQSNGVHTAGDYSIRQEGNLWNLRYNGTLIHTGVSLEECKIEADKHRGVNRAG